MSELATLYLKPREERRIRAGHLWVFSNELDVKRQPLKGLEPGQLCQLRASNGRVLGSGYVNPASLIAVRLLTRRHDVALDDTAVARLLRERIQDALALREALYPAPGYRLVHGEGDGLPGLIVDRYADWLVVELTTAGMDRLRDTVIASLVKLLQPAGILLRNDSAIRDLEGLPRSVELAHGSLPKELPVLENGLEFAVPSEGAQKTGWYYDQASNRQRLSRYLSGQRLLDVCSYAGGWAVHAARHGAGSVTCLDSSAAALGWAEANAHRNSVELATHQGDAFQALAELHTAGERYGVIVVDPPALIPRRKDRDAGLTAYQRLNSRAMALLEPGGFLVSCSCSHHLSGDDLRSVLRRAAGQAGRRLQLLETGGAGPDHPVHPAIPETAYLKAHFCRLL